MKKRRITEERWRRITKNKKNEEKEWKRNWIGKRKLIEVNRKSQRGSEVKAKVWKY